MESLSTVHRYPDGGGTTLKKALAERLGVDATQITLGNGSNDLLELVGRCFLTPERSAIYSRHSFAVYDLVVRLNGARAIISAPNLIGDEMPLGDNPQAILEGIEPHTAVIFIANPNNPTGTWLKRNQLQRLLEQVPASVIVVVDQAYAEYAENADGYASVLDCLDQFPNLIVTQTFSKIYALAGLRIGYAVSSPQIADWFNRVRQPFNANAVAQAAALAALDDQDHLQQSIAMNREGLEQIMQGCRHLGLSYLPSTANFLCIEVGQQMLDIYKYLLEEGVVVRPVENYGLPHYLRVTIGRDNDNQAFLEGLGKAREALCND